MYHLCYENGPFELDTDRFNVFSIVSPLVIAVTLKWKYILENALAGAK